MTTPQLLSKNVALAELSRVALKSGQPDAFKGARELIERIFNPRTPSYKLSPEGVIFTFMAAAHLIHKDESGAYLALMNSIIEVLGELGYRKNILTFQEHALKGNSVRGKFSQIPHVPIGIFEGQLTLEEARKSRQLVAMTDALRSNYGIGDTARTSSISVSLEPLDDSGRTVRDPRIINPAVHPSMINYLLKTLPFEQALERLTFLAQKRKDFPFRRD